MVPGKVRQKARREEIDKTSDVFTYGTANMYQKPTLVVWIVKTHNLTQRRMRQSYFCLRSMCLFYRKTYRKWKHFQ